NRLVCLLQVPSSYLILWVTVDVLSAVIIITVFIVQRIRLYGTSFIPETISLNSTARSAQGHRSRNMKEKLLYNMTDGDLVEEVDVRAGHGGVVNQPASSYSMAPSTTTPTPVDTTMGTPSPTLSIQSSDTHDVTN
ncbi:glycerophosphodiester phosphodiesterase domain-containing protein 5-like, partial [Haliotis rubra]|uniref:glycerophosphodiester phosphodiesterase domain-containing protein 5-like n=1 Tax=Haliotis rubra TaxID=36100 RepID=UPI001EE60C19